MEPSLNDNNEKALKELTDQSDKFIANKLLKT